MLTKLSTFNSRLNILLQGIGDTELSSNDRDIAIKHAVAEYSVDRPKESTILITGNGASYYLLDGIIYSLNESNLNAGLILKSEGENSKYAIKFSLSYPQEIEQVDLWLSRIGSTVKGTLSLSICADDNGLPGMVIATSQSVDIDDIDGAGELYYREVKFSFINRCKLSAGDYYLLLNAVDYEYVEDVNVLVIGAYQDDDAKGDIYSYDDVNGWSRYQPASDAIMKITGGVEEWSKNSSSIISVEYPASIIENNEEPQLLDIEDYQMFTTESGDYLRLINLSASSGEFIRMKYKHPYRWSEGTDPVIDIPQAHYEAICNLSASIACNWLSTRYGQSTVSSISADSVDHRTKPDIYRSLSNDYKKIYRRLLGLPEKDDEHIPSMTIVDIDFGPANNRDFLFHTRDTR